MVFTHQVYVVVAENAESDEAKMVVSIVFINFDKT
jgi:hypothetical protein